MTKAKLLTVALLATTILLFAGFINGLVDSSGGAAQAGTIFIDDFSDGDYADGKPVSWLPGELVPGIFEATTEGLVIRLAGERLAGLGADIPTIKDTSMRAQIRVSGIGATAVMSVRDNGVTGYAAAVGYDPSLGGSFLVVGAATGEIAQLSYFQDMNGQLTSRLPFDVRTTDALVQLDVFGNELRVWAWQTGKDRPDQPQFEVTDDTWTEAGQTGIMLTTSPGAPAGIDRSATFRFVQVSTRSIPEPASAQLAFLGVALLGLLIRKRRRLGEKAQQARTRRS